MTLDSSKFSDVGKYGTIYLMKTQDPTDPLTAFPLDDEETTFGRDSSCSIRLYYPQVSPLHGKIIFQERKAYLVVLGATGLHVDGCKVMPNLNTTSLNPEPRTVPLTSDTEIRIHTKLFKFTYPPKELRAALLATPAKTPHGKRRALRLSMIQSAQVFTPRPSPDPRENLRILQSPLRPFSSPKKPSPLQTQSSDETDDEEDEEIVLVDGNHPRVVEDEKDLVILEDVEVSDQGAHAQRLPLPPAMPPPIPQINAPPQTPQRRFPRPSLHKAVLIRSAQRAVIKAEIEREEAEEEREVEAFATQVMQSGSESSSGEEDEIYGDEFDVDNDADQPTWKKGLQAVQRTLWPFGGSTEAELEEDDEDIPDSSDVKQDSVEPSNPGSSRNYGKFMTPQVTRTTGPIAGRFSVGGGGEARRVVVEPRWRVNDIELPPVSEVKNKVDYAHESLTTPMASRRERLSDEERKAIQERRRSALRTPDSFFGGQTPGICKFPGFPTSPSKPASGTSPVKSYSPMKAIPEPDEEDDDDDDLDTRSLLDKMKETVEEMKRRRSLAPAGLGTGPGSPNKQSASINPSPKKREPAHAEDRRFSLLAPAVREEIFGNRDDLDESPEGGEMEHVPAESDQEEMDITDEVGDDTEDEEGQAMEDEDKENIVAEPSSSSSMEKSASQAAPPSVDQRLPPETPRMDGLKCIFAEPRQAPATPSFVGIRDIFKTRETRAVATPTYEGLRELIPTPTYDAEDGADSINDRPPSTAPVVEVSYAELPGQEEQAIEDPAPKTRTMRISKKSTRIATSKDTPSLADDEATPGSHDHPDGSDRTSDTEEDSSARPNLRASRTKKVAKDAPAAPAKPKRTRAATAANEPATSSLKPPSRARSTTSKGEESSGSELPTKKPVSRRKATTVSSVPLNNEGPPSESTEPAPVVRRGRKVASKKDEPATSTAEEGRKSLPKATRRTRTTAIAAKSETEKPSPATDGTESTAPRRGVATRTRAKDIVKEEETEDSDLSKPEDAPVERSTRKVATKKTTSRIPSQKGTPTASQQKDKENTPGSGDGDDEPVEKPAKVKVTRAKKPAVVKSEEAVEEVPKRTRMTRTRVKA